VIKAIHVIQNGYGRDVKTFAWVRRGNIFLIRIMPLEMLFENSVKCNAVCSGIALRLNGMKVPGKVLVVNWY